MEETIETARAIYLCKIACEVGKQFIRNEHIEDGEDGLNISLLCSDSDGFTYMFPIYNDIYKAWTDCYEVGSNFYCLRAVSIELFTKRWLLKYYTSAAHFMDNRIEIEFIRKFGDIPFELYYGVGDYMVDTARACYRVVIEDGGKRVNFIEAKNYYEDGESND